MLNPNLPNPQQFSSIGNIATAGLRLYFMRFKLYLRMAITAHLWLLIPLFGWAKFCAISARLAQLSFHDLVRSPETSIVSSKQFDRRGWNVLITNLLVIVMVVLVAVLALIIFAFIFGIIAELISLIFSVSPAKLNPAQSSNATVKLAVGLGGNLFLLGAGIWFYARYFVVEFPLVLECNYKPMKAIKRCHSLTKKSTLFIFGVITIALVLTCPLSYLLVNVFGFRLISLALRALQLDFSTRQVIGYSLSFVLGLSVNAVTMPFWQATKAVLYYSLRSRREGFDLQFCSPDRFSESA